MIINAESVLVQPVDRDYNRKGLQRETHLEPKDDGISHALRTGGQLLVLLSVYESKGQEDETRDNMDW